MPQELTSLNELSKQLDINKSQLSYYVSLGLLRPITTVGKMQIFDKKEASMTISLIQKLRSESKTLKQIKEKIVK